VPRAKNEWRREPYPGELLYHLKWTHGVWVSEATKGPDLDNIHRQLHGPKPDGWLDPHNTWDPGHKHEWPAQQLTLPTEDTGDNWEW
jgi:hypothetical protein